jgi:hypothetical protein
VDKKDYRRHQIWDNSTWYDDTQIKSRGTKSLRPNAMSQVNQEIHERIDSGCVGEIHLADLPKSPSDLHSGQVGIIVYLEYGWTILFSSKPWVK